MTKKIKILLAIGAGILVLILLAITLTLVFHRSYLQKTDYDHMADVTYNDLQIVGRGGLFYLSRNGKAISDGYVSLQSVNDAYASERTDWQSAEDLTLYDFFVARRAGESEYYLLSAEGDAYRITGDNYSLEEIRLPYLIFVNNTTGRHAALSLDRLDSDLSYCAGSELTLHPFTSVVAVRSDPNRLLYSHLETYDAVSEQPYSIFSKNGSCLFSTKQLTKSHYTWNDTYRAVYYRDLTASTVYASDGTLLGENVSVVSESDGSWCLARVTDPKSGGAALLILSSRKSTLLSEADYDLSSPTVLSGSLLLPMANGEGMAVIAARDGTVTACADAQVTAEGIVRATVSDSHDLLIFSETGALLLKTPYDDMVALPALSDPDCIVLESARYNDEQGSRHLYFAHEGSVAVSIGLSQGVDISPLFTHEGLPISGSFLLTETDERGNTVYRMLTPFTNRTFSDTYDRLDIYSHAGMLWARGTSYRRLTYSFLDPISGQTAATVTCTAEEMALGIWELDSSDSLLSDPYDGDSAVPLLMLRLAYEGNNTGTAGSVRYFALYRSATASSRTYQSGTLRITELGKGLLRTQPFRFFSENNILVSFDADSSRVYRLTDSAMLSEVASIPYHVTQILRDRSDPSIVYFVVRSDTGKEGLYDANGSPVLAPYYDDIRSADRGHFTLSLRGAWGVVEYTAGTVRPILDYLYADILPLPDHAYLATNGNRETYLFEGKDCLSEDAVQSYRILRSYHINEDSELCYRESVLISMNGYLSVHQCEFELRPTATDFERAEVQNPNIENERALAIYYYHEGKQIHKAVLLPTAADRNAFALPESPNGSGWYWKEGAGEDDVPVTKEDILALSAHTLTLHTKN